MIAKMQMTDDDDWLNDIFGSFTVLKCVCVCSVRGLVWSHEFSLGAKIYLASEIVCKVRLIRRVMHC